MMYQGKAIKKQSRMMTSIKKTLTELTLSTLFIATILIVGSEEFADLIINIIGG